MTRPIRVIVVDDHEIVRVGVRSLLDREHDINVIGTAATGERGLELIGSLQPDVAVLDYNLPGMSGVELCGEIVRRWPEVHVVILTTFLDDNVIRNSIDAGAKAYVYKDVEGRDLKRAVRSVAAGHPVIDGKAAARVLRLARTGSSRDPVALSPREVDVLRLVARGQMNAEIGRTLGISINTVKTCLNRALKKLGCHSRTHAAAVAAKRGLL
jgi:DNA-binding NarL/FixJ family response regulator